VGASTLLLARERGTAVTASLRRAGRVCPASLRVLSRSEPGSLLSMDGGTFRTLTVSVGEGRFEVRVPRRDLPIVEVAMRSHDRPSGEAS
jgi:hypothetical protein